MYQIEDKILRDILKRKFNSFVGVLCERVENLEKLNLDKTQLIQQVKFDLKKDAYSTMREIEDQISSFSEGTTIQVTLTKHTSQAS
jgi:hypothetical protein